MTIDDDQRPRVTRLPDDPQARAAIEDWIARSPEAELWGNGLCFAGADFTDVHVWEAWLMWADMRGSRLVGTDLAGGWLSAADFRDVDMTGAILPNIAANDTDFSGARLAGANLRGMESFNTRFRGAALCGAELRGLLHGVDLRGADLREVNFLDLGLGQGDLCQAELRGAHGRVRGPFWLDIDGDERLVDGTDASEHLAHRGADVEVIEPKP